MIMGMNQTKDLEKMQTIKKQMLSVVMYSEPWFVLKKRWEKIFKNIEEKRGGK